MILTKISTLFSILVNDGFEVKYLMFYFQNNACKNAEEISYFIRKSFLLAFLKHIYNKVTTGYIMLYAYLK